MTKKHSETITYRRQAGKIKYNLLEIIVMVICLAVAEYEAWHQIKHYCKSKKVWFRKKLKMKLKYGVPSHDTFERSFGMIDPKEFEKCFSGWVNEVKQ